jgi:hypothetical protein
LKPSGTYRTSQGTDAPAEDKYEPSSTTTQQTSTTTQQTGYSLLGAPSLAPEEVVARSGLNSVTVTGFLFENYLEFIDADAIEDVAAVAANFSDAICIVQAQPGGVLCASTSAAPDQEFGECKKERFQS